MNLLAKIIKARQEFGYLPEVSHPSEYNFAQKTVFYSDRSLRYIRRPTLLERNPPFIFGIGLSKTATTSLAAALEYLGYPASHWNYPRELLRYDNGKLRVNPNKLLVSFRAYADTPISRTYRLLDKTFPGSKFILTVREEKSWFKSFSNWMGSEGRNHCEPGLTEFLHNDLYGSSVPEKEINISSFQHFNKTAIQYFSSRPSDFLVMNIIEGDGWEKLCCFLDKPTPEIPFPKTNISEIIK